MINLNKYYAIEFDSNQKLYTFKTDKTIELETRVIVDTEKGLQLGIVKKEYKEVPKLDGVKKILREATDEDYDKFLKNKIEAKEASQVCKEYIEELNLKMDLVSTSYSLDKKTLLFNFVAGERVDFRELVKRLSYRFKTRIELFQIGPRDRAKSQGGIGVCGQKLCCSRFLKKGESVSIAAAKNQNIALNPNKINGRCGYLLCCLNYEDDLYKENKKRLPKVGEKVKHNKKTCEVINVNVLNKEYTIICDSEEVIVKKDEHRKK